MNFWQIFFRVLPRRPGAALMGLWWQVFRRKVRARNCLRVASADLPFAYKLWIRNIERQDERAKSATYIVSRWKHRPSFVVAIDGRHCSTEALSRSIRSVQAQSYKQWQLLVIAEQAVGEAIEAVCDSWASALARSNSDFFVPLGGGDQLSKLALFHFANALQDEPNTLILYGDEDQIDVAGRRRQPWFKPKWNKELFLALDYVSRAFAIAIHAARDVVANTGNDVDPYRLILYAMNRTDQNIIHIPSIITHVANHDREATQTLRVRAVREFLAPAGAEAEPGPFGSVKVSWPLPANLPLVTIIVPTKDKLELVRACAESILARTNYWPYELLIVDNGSKDPATLIYLDQLERQSGVRVLRDPSPYNYSAINNFAAREAAGTYLCLLNNDTEVLGGEWLTEMMRFGIRPEIGAVGAKLLYPDRTIQHAGVVVGIGDAAGHAHRNLPSHQPGYFAQPHSSQFVSAVTGACLLVEKRKFLAVGGLDQDNLPIAYSDVDLCLKLERAGWRNVYVPYAVLLHHESKSRAKDQSPGRIEFYRRELEAFQERWGAKEYNDPQLNPNLDRSSETFVMRF